MLTLSVPTVKAEKQLKIVYNIDISASNQIQPSVFEDTLVFIDDGNSSYNVFMYDLRSQNLTQITSDTYIKQHPHIHLSKIVWEEYRVDNWDIFLYYINQDAVVQVTNNPSNQSNPFVFGNYITWQDDRHGNWDIYIYDINAQTERQVTNSSAAQISPKMSKNGMDTELIWIDKGEDGEDSEIFELRLTAFDESLENIKQITDDEYDQIHFAASFNNVVYTCDQNGSNNMFIYNYETEVVDQVTVVGIDQKYPAIDDENIVWTDKRTNHNEIYQFNMIFWKQFQLTESKTPKSDVQINHNWVVWVEEKDGVKDIYYLDLREDVPQERSSDNLSLIIGFILIFLAFLIIINTFRKPEKKYLPTIAEINKMRKKEDLTKLCKKFRLNPNGNKTRLRKRLITYIESKQKIKAKASVRDKAEKTQRKKTISNPPLASIILSSESTADDIDFNDVELKNFEEFEEIDLKLDRLSKAIRGKEEILREQRKELNEIKKELKQMDTVMIQKDKEIEKLKVREVELNKDAEEIRKLLLVLDDLLEKLPEEIIEKFAMSDDCILYQKVLKKYKI